MRLRPFFPYYGSKWLLARHYPVPAHAQIIEPFSGSASYAVNYADRAVLLVDNNPRVVALWRYLIAVSSSELLAIPTHAQSTDEVSIPEQKLLLGMWFGRATAMCGTRKTMSKWGRDTRSPTSFWGPSIQQRLARQVEQIRHWKVVEGEYSAIAPNIATWFVDPPYTVKGRYYRSAPLDYSALAEWCAGLRGQVIVCENEGADWLPFKPFRVGRANSSWGAGRTTKEAIWERAA